MYSEGIFLLNYLFFFCNRELWFENQDELLISSTLNLGSRPVDLQGRLHQSQNPKELTGGRDTRPYYLAWGQRFSNNRGIATGQDLRDTIWSAVAKCIYLMLRNAVVLVVDIPRQLPLIGSTVVCLKWTRYQNAGQHNTH